MSRKTAKLKRKIQKINEALEIFTEMYGWCYFNRLTAGKTVKDFYGSLCSPDIEKEVDSCLVESINEGVIGHSDNNIS